MKLLRNTIFLILLMIVGCQTKEEADLSQDFSKNRFEKISYHKFPTSKVTQKPFQYRLSYYYENGYPYRWMELDSVGTIMTDYIYQYDTSWRQTGAIYTEDGVKKYAQELVRFDNDSTRITEWIDSMDVVYYTMIDNLNKSGKTYRATFIGDTTHGYDSTFYTKEGFEKRIFFTNVKGKIYNNRSFVYDSINEMGDWIFRKKIMNDSIVEYQKREIYYDSNFTSKTGQFYEGVISSSDWDENVISFSENEKYTFFTRTKDWLNQSGYISTKSNGVYTLPKGLDQIDSIYNGAISPTGNRIIYSKRNQDIEEMWLLNKKNGEWTAGINLTKTSGIRGGYFNWLNNEELYFYVPDNNGDIVEGKLIGDDLSITNSLEILNSKKATEFSPFIDRNKRFIIFTRYLEGNENQQGFFLSYNENTFKNPKWTIPKKITDLPYGWSAYVSRDFTRFIFTNGKNIQSVPIERLALNLSQK